MQTKELMNYMEEFQATVVSCEKKSEDKWLVALDQTTFFPEGGGQSGDCGWLNDLEVVNACEKAGVIYHEVMGTFEVGMQVSGKVNAAARFDKMQQHTGEHILSGIVCAAYGYHNV